MGLLLERVSIFDWRFYGYLFVKGCRVLGVLILVFCLKCLLPVPLHYILDKFVVVRRPCGIVQFIVREFVGNAASGTTPKDHDTKVSQDREFIDKNSNVLKPFV